VAQNLVAGKLHKAETVLWLWEKISKS